MVFMYFLCSSSLLDFVLGRTCEGWHRIRRYGANLEPEIATIASAAPEAWTGFCKHCKEGVWRGKSMRDIEGERWGSLTEREREREQGAG